MNNEARTPLLEKGGVAAPSREMTRRLLFRRGRGGSFKRPLIFLNSTTPSAPFKGGFAAFLDGAATPPQLRRGVLLTTKSQEPNK